ncbi:MAG: bifunctional UDP-N-acetylglucosamine diphosphorylase/glucosamine-1-phosphate N-acetyltransferase GlmU [Bacilli bacterium]|nr:bifunctional UDP-N-acetylglucosamine diphosphorylase/glucosamine-1-phosphate N-acetyltransferase GlmU [Bacilli bacterium]
MDKHAIILAAGKGSRMKSKKEELSKVSYKILGKPLLKYVIDALKEAGLDDLVTVVGFGGETAKAIAEPHSKVVWQHEQKGSGHAVMMAETALKDAKGYTLVCCGDAPLLRSNTLKEMFETHEKDGNDLTVMTAIIDNPFGYGRIVKKDGRVIKIVEEKDTTVEEKAIKEINSGLYIFDNQELFKALKEVKTDNAAGEYYLTDVLGIFVSKGLKAGTYVVKDFEETLGINDRYQLSVAGKILQHRINKELMLSGVTIEDPDNTYIAPDVKIGADTVIRPNTHIYGNTVIGEDNVIGPDSYFEDVTIGNKNEIIYSHMVETTVGDLTTLGPWLRTRKNASIGDKAHIGNFNEVKNVNFGVGSKMAHLSYVGDATIGSEVNIGCGTIIANYDGVNKFHSDIGDHAFIGSGTTIISPVKVGDYGFTAAGSTINLDIEDHAMAIARSRQVNKEGYSDIFHDKALAKKKNK